jgi:hypothetical protein
MRSCFHSKSRKQFAEVKATDMPAVGRLLRPFSTSAQAKLVEKFD